MKQFCRVLNNGKVTVSRLGLMGMVFLFSIFQLSAEGGWQFEDPGLKYFFEDPATLEQYELLDKVPNGLFHRDEKASSDGIAEAIELYSADAVANGERIGLVMGLKSEGSVYEHSKYVTDRINGAEIKDIFSHSFRNIFPLLVSKYQTPEGNTEVTCSFSAFLDAEEGFTLESHWNTEEYSKGETFYNFQLWAEDIGKLELVVGEVLTKLMLKAEIAEVYTTKSPKVYIARQSYQNGMLVLDVVNRAGIEQVALSGSRESEFLIERTPTAMTVNLSGAEKERVVVPAPSEHYVAGSVKFVNHSSNAVKNPNRKGSWGVYYDELAASVDHFQIQESRVMPNGRPTAYLERNLSLEGVIRDELLITRTVQPGTSSVDYSKYNALATKIAGVSDLEVILVKASIANFEEQPTAYVRMTAPVAQLVLRPGDFIQAEDKADWSDVQSVIFRKRGTGFQEALTLTIEDLQFTRYKEIPDCECTIMTGPEGGTFAGRNRKRR